MFRIAAGSLAGPRHERPDAVVIDTGSKADGGWIPSVGIAAFSANPTIHTDSSKVSIP